MSLSRRDFLRYSGIGLGSLMLPMGMPFTARAQAAGGPSKTLVVIFLGGGADGLNLVIPRDDPAYDARRMGFEGMWWDPVAANQLGSSGWEMHPEFVQSTPGGLGRLKELFDAGDLSVVQAVGGTASRSHFQARDAMERANPDAPYDDANGWLYRTLQQLDLKGGELRTDIPVLSSITLGKSLQGSLYGDNVVHSLAFPNLASFAIHGAVSSAVRAQREAAMLAMYDAPGSASPPDLVRRAGAGALSATGELNGLAAGLGDGVFESGGWNGFNNVLRDAARLIRAEEIIQSDPGVRIIALDMGGWDHHSQQGPDLDRMARSLAIGLAGFRRLLAAPIGGSSSDALDDTMVLAMTEFGRTVRPNKDNGTDHGTGSVMFAMGGGNFRGGEVFSLGSPDGMGGQQGVTMGNGRLFPGLGDGQLFEDRDLAATTDFRDVFDDVLRNFLGLTGGEVDPVLRSHPVTAGYESMFS